MKLIAPEQMNFVSKRWGWELWICNNDRYCGKVLFIKQGHFCSFHYHRTKDETLYVQSGRMRMTYGELHAPKHFDVGPGYAFHIEPGVIHQMEALEDTHILEVSTTHRDEDSFRVVEKLVFPHHPRQEIAK